MPGVVSEYLNLLDAQRESAFAALNGLTDTQLWQRPAPREWSIGEILDHNYLLVASFYPAVKWIWKLNGWYRRLRRGRPYKTEIEGLYRSPFFRNGSTSCGLRGSILVNRFRLKHLNLKYETFTQTFVSFTKAGIWMCLEIYIFMIRCLVGATSSSHCGSESITINCIMMMWSSWPNNSRHDLYSPRIA
jgi:hypothetical protein